MDGRKGWEFNNMGKDIDRNITRQLYEKFKNIFSLYGYFNSNKEYNNDFKIFVPFI